MIEVITGAPPYCWPLLAYLIFIGIKSRKTRWVSTKMLAVLPTAFLVGSYYSSPFSLPFWVVCQAFGAFLGFLMIRRINVKFDKNGKLVELPGSWVNLGMSLSIFAIRYYLGVIYALFPSMIGSWPLMNLEIAAVVISGMFLGRLIGFWQKYNSREALS